MKREYLTRQEETLPVEKCGVPIMVVGAGAIGSFTVLSLAKMGFDNITVYDPDNVDKENINVQFYPTLSIGHPKVHALRDMIKMFTGTNIDCKHGNWGPGDGCDFYNGIVISAVDNMNTRKDIYRDFVGRDVLLIDPRMSIEYLHVQAVRMADADEFRQGQRAYHSSLYSDEEAVQERCTNKAIMYTVELAAGIVSQMVKCYATGSRMKREIMWHTGKMHAIGLEALT